MSLNDGFTEFLLDCAPTDVEILGSWNVLDRQDVEVRSPPGTICLQVRHNKVPQRADRSG